MQLGAAGIKPADLNYKCLTMDSGKFICIRETEAGGICVIDTANPTTPIRMPAPVEFACISGDGATLALCAQTTVQMFNFEDKTQLKSADVREAPVYMKWAAPGLLAIVTPSRVFHWSLEGDAAPVEAFARDASLAQSQIINYKVSSDGNWMMLNGLAAGPDGSPTGQIQLFSKEKGVSQPVPAHAGAFADIPADEALMFVFTDKAGAAGTFKATKIGGAGPAIAGVQAPAQYPPAGGQDFPVAMVKSTKYDVAYMMTKMGFLYVVDVKTCATIFSNQVSMQPVFIASANETTGGITFVNQGGQVLTVTLDEDAVIEHIAMVVKNFEVAQRLSMRNNLPGAVIDNMVQQQFESLYSSRNFEGCAQLAVQAEKLRSSGTIARIKAAPAQPQGPPPIMVYFNALITATKLNSVESCALIKELLPLGQMAFIEAKVAEDKIACTEDVGDLIKTAANNPKLAMQIYVKGKCHGRVVLGFIGIGQADKISPYLDQAGAAGSVDWVATINEAIAVDPTAALTAASAVAAKGVELDMLAITDLFVKKQAIQQATGFLVTHLTAKPASSEDDAALQTKALEVPLCNGFPQVAESLIDSGKFLHYDKAKIAPLCEKNSLPNKALELFTEPADIKRVIVMTNQPKLSPEFVIPYFAKLDPTLALECLEAMINSNLKVNGRLVAQVAATYSGTLGNDAIISLFKQTEAVESLFLYLSTVVNTTLDPEVHFGYIEAATKSGNVAEVERMTRESSCYDAARVRDFLMESKLEDPRPLINVCKTHNFVPELVKYFISQQQMKFIEQFALNVDVASVPLVCGTLIDQNVNEDFIKNLILAGGNMIPAGTLMEEMQQRGKLKFIMPWLEARVNEGSTDTSVHTALAKIYVDSNQNPEQFLLTNQYYNALDVGKHCEARYPALAVTAYQKGNCSDALVEVTTNYSMWKEQATYLVEALDEELWGRVLKEDNDARGQLVDHLVGQVLPECKDAHKIALVVKVFLAADLPKYLIELLDKIILQTGQFRGEKALETLLIKTAVKSNQERVSDYISRLDAIDPVQVAAACTEEGLHEEAIMLYEKAGEKEKAMGVMVDGVKDLERATSYAGQCDDSAVWSILGRAQLDAGMVDVAIKTYAKANDVSAFQLVIDAAKRENAYESLVEYLVMTRSMGQKNETVDTELVYAYCKTEKLVDLEQFIVGPNVANVSALGKRCFDEEMFEAAKVLFTNAGDHASLATTLCKMNDLAGAVEAARKANALPTWTAVCKEAVAAKEFRLAQQCGVNIIVEPDVLEDIISFYEQEGYVEEIMALMESGLGLERAHLGMFTELGVLYAKYKVDKLMEHCKVFWARMNIGKLIRICEVGEHWAVQCFLYEKFDEFDNAVMCMINHVAEVFDHQQCIELLSKGGNIEIVHKAIDFYLEYSPMELNDMLVYLTSRLDHIRVVNQIQRTGNLPLVKVYLEHIQQLNIPQLNDPINTIWIEEGNHAKLRASVDAYTNFDMIGLAVQLETHDCLEFRRIATHLYKKVQKWTEAVSLAKKDELYKDAIETAATSKDPALVDELLKFFVEKSNKECFAAVLFMCYDFVHPDTVMELAWRNGIMDFAMPYFIQVLGEFKQMKVHLAEMGQALTALLQGGGAAPPAAPVPQQPVAPQQAAGGFGFVS
eukprot:SAG31_NODE_492_length_14913_cov_4.109086_5_plen_1645_part_00